MTPRDWGQFIAAMMVPAGLALGFFGTWHFLEWRERRRQRKERGRAGQA